MLGSRGSLSVGLGNIPLNLSVAIPTSAAYLAFMPDRPRCYGTFDSSETKCNACYVFRSCDRASSPSRRETRSPKALKTNPVSGTIQVDDIDLGFTLSSGQVFRWGRDRDGWWKGIGYGTVIHLRQSGKLLHYRASSDRIRTFSDVLEIETFLSWYLRLREPARVRIPRGDRHLREALKALRGFRFVRQEPFECTISYVLSVQAHMGLTRRRIAWLSKLLGNRIDFLGQSYWTFPAPELLADLNGPYLRSHRFGYRSEKTITTARIISDHTQTVRKKLNLNDWRKLADLLHATPGSGVGLKVARCIDLFSLDRLSSFAVDTWVRKLAKDWYGVNGSDAQICAWGDARYGNEAGYAGEHLFAWYREQNATSLEDRVISFCATGAPSSELPYEKKSEEG